MKKVYFLFLIVILHINSAFSENVLQETVKSAAKTYLESHFMNGVYRFCDNDDVIIEGAKGVFSKQDKKQLEINQQMPVASTTKTFTAAGILTLQDDGKLNVNDPIAKHLTKESGVWRDKELPKWTEKVTIHNLLTHRSGLTEYFMGIEPDVSKTHDEINKDIIGFLAEKELRFEPGSKHEYNNSNFVVLGLIIEKVSGKILADFYSEKFFQPLGLNNTKLLSIGEALDNQRSHKMSKFPTRYFVTPTGAEPAFNIAESKYLMIPYADGGIASTTEDLVKWHQAIHAGKVVSDEAYQLMTSRHYEITDNTGIKNYIGYGLYISELENGDVFYHHAGSAVAIRSESGCIPSKQLCFAMLSNVMEYLPKDKADQIDSSLEENKLDIKYFKQYILNSVGKIEK